MRYRIGDRQFEAESRYLTLALRASNDLLDDPDALRRRLAADGYLMLRGLHEPAEVLAARRDILARMAEEGLLAPAHPLMDGVANPEPREAPTTSVRARQRLKTPTLAAVVDGDRIVRLFVDRDLTEGVFSRDPAELVERLGGRWATSSFRAGDVAIFGIFLLHASLANATGRYRLSCDTRYQRAAEPMDDRWVKVRETGFRRKDGLGAAGPEGPTAVLGCPRARPPRP